VVTRRRARCLERFMGSLTIERLIAEDRKEPRPRFATGALSS
jgi:hypothetical protein